MDNVAVSNALLFTTMSRASEPAAAEDNEPHTGVEVLAVASSEAATYNPTALFITPTSAADAPGSSAAQPSPQELLTPSTGGPALQEQRTIFVAGFPLDMTEREFSCLLTFLPGYEACQLSWGTGAPQGFALFKCNADAVAAVERLAGHQVEVGAVLRAELAHKNLVIKVGGREAGPGRDRNCTRVGRFWPLTVPSVQ